MRIDLSSGMGSRGASGSHGSMQNSFLEGIPMRLTDKYRPQRRVILPPEYTNRLQEDIEAILDLDYDFKVEKQVLAAYATKNEGKTEGETPWPSATTVDGITAVLPPGVLKSSANEDATRAKTRTHTPPPRPPPPIPTGAGGGAGGAGGVGTGVAGTGGVGTGGVGGRVGGTVSGGVGGVSINPLLASVSYRPMEPQKAQLPSTYTNTDTAQNAGGRGFRVEDFEPNTANPFDHLELKSLNDMEQLQQVLAKDKESKS